MRKRHDPDLAELVELGRMLDVRNSLLGGRTTSTFLAQALLRIRNREGKNVPLVPNRVQLEYERLRGRNNIVLKARQVGISTWVAGQFFLKTVTRPGTMTVQVAHTHDSAEAIFRIVHRFFESLPANLRKGALRTSRASARQLVFPALAASTAWKVRATGTQAAESPFRTSTARRSHDGRGIRRKHSTAFWPRCRATESWC